jgi:hypothetical protein
MNVARRDVLRGIALLSVAVGVAGCTETPEEPPPPDPLADLAARARADAALAEAVTPVLPAAAEVAAARGEHASALREEVDRARPPASSTSPAPPKVEQPPADPAAARTALLDALTSAEKQAAGLIASVPAYRAGLVGSVAAGCASLREVLA